MYVTSFVRGSNKHIVFFPHLEESWESRGSSALPSVPCSSSSSCSSPLPDPSPDWDPEGPGREPDESEVPKPEGSEGVAVCMIFCRTSLILSCRHNLVGNMSEYLVWKAAVAWAVKKKNQKWIWQKLFRFQYLAWAEETRAGEQCSEITVKVELLMLPDGKNPCSWNSCITSARLWSSVLRREEYGTLSNSRSVRMSSPSVPKWEAVLIKDAGFITFPYLTMYPTKIFHFSTESSLHANIL